jgi:hypothetical protein
MFGGPGGDDSVAGTQIIEQNIAVEELEGLIVLVGFLKAITQGR